MESLGGVFLVQELQPKRLVGSVRATTQAQGPGWIYVVFSQEPELLFLKCSGDQVALVLERAMVMSFIALLQVQVMTNRCLRGEDPHRTAHAGTHDTGVRVSECLERSGMFAASWIPDEVRVRCVQADGSVELYIREDVAEELGIELAAEMARIAARA